MGFTQPGMGLGIRARMMGSRKTVPPRILRIYRTVLSIIRFDVSTGELTVPLGLFHISLSLNSSTRASSGVTVAHLMPTLYRWIASAASTVTASFVCLLVKFPWRVQGDMPAYLITVL